MSGEVRSGLPSIDGTQPIIGADWVQIGGPQGKKISLDHLSKAEQDLVIEYLLSAQIPILPPPQTVTNSTDSGSISSIGSTSVSSMDFSIQQRQNEIIMSMLDAWSKGIQEQAERSKIDDQKKVLENVAIAYHTFQHQINMQTDPNFPIFAVGLIIAGSAIAQLVTPVTNSAVIAMNPIVNIQNATIVPIVGALAAPVAMFGAVFAAGIQFFTVAQMTANTVGKKEKPINGDFAKGYAENIVNLVGSPAFNAYLGKLVTQNTTEANPMSASQAEDLEAMIKVVLLSTSLAMLYKVEAGKMTSIEFNAMVFPANFPEKARIVFESNDIRTKLVLLIQMNFESIKDPETKKRFMSALDNYFDSDPRTEDLSNPAKVFEGIYSVLPRGELAG